MRDRAAKDFPMQHAGQTHRVSVFGAPYRGGRHARARCGDTRSSIHIRAADASAWLVVRFRSS
jgi:hypothetical protein